MKVEEISIRKIIVGDRARQDYGDLTELIGSIREKGIIQPLTVDASCRLLAGGRRLKAATEAGLDRVPCVVRRTEGDIDALEIELFENIHRKDFLWAERAKLEKRILELKRQKDPEWTQRDQAEATDTSIGLVNRRLQLAEALEAVPELADCKTEDEAWKAYKKLEEKIITDALVEKAKSKALKGVKIADKNYMVKDVFTGMESLKPEQYHFAEVDPPYGVELDRRKSRNKDGGGMEEYHEWSATEYPKFITRLAEECYRVLQPHSFAVWWYGMSWHETTLAILREVGFAVSDIPAIWYKGPQGQTASPDTMLGSSYEPFFVCRKGDGKLARPGRSNVFAYAPLAPTKKIHPTEKPLELMLDILETFTFPGVRVVVPLLGSGVTLRACYCTGRIGFGFDLSHENKQRFLAKVADDEASGLYEKEPEK